MTLYDISKFDFDRFKYYVEIQSMSGDMVLSDYCDDMNKIVQLKCSKGRIFQVTPYEYICGLRCVKCLNGTHEYSYKTKDEEKISFVESKGYEVTKFGSRMKLICLEGHECEIRYTDFKNCGRRCQECGSSSGETAVKEYLKRNNVDFLHQYKDNNCHDDGVLSFDFAVIINTKLIGLIEYDGLCHYRTKDIYKSMEGLLHHQRRDNIKTEFCKAQGIPLLRIPYWRIKNIDEILDEWLKGKI